MTDSIFDLAASLGGDIAVDLARPHKPMPPSKPPRKPTNTKPLRAAIDSGRGGKGAVERASRPVESPARQSPQHAGGPVEPDPEGGRAGGSSPAPGAVSGFVLPQPPRLSFAEGAHRLVGRVMPPRPGQPDPRPNPNPNPPPAPPPGALLKT